MGLFCGCNLASFVLSLHSAPSDAITLVALKRFVDNALSLGHQIKTIFLYQDGVYHALDQFDVSSDEFDVAALWQQLFDSGIELSLCITAANKRGVDTEQVKLFTVSGLAEFAMLATDADRWVQFK